MRLSSIQVQNFKSIVNTGEIRIGNLQSFVGENNSGKSNLLKAIDVFLSSGTGGVQESYFFDKAKPLIITAKFCELRDDEKRALRIYMIGDELILEKKIFIQTDVGGGKNKIISEYHGYQAKPKNWWLSTDGVIEHENTNRPDWKRIAEDNDLLIHAQNTNSLQTINKTVYEKIVQDYLEHEENVEYDVPVLGETQALGIQPNLLRYLPRFYMLAAITDYSSEIDKRSSTTIFRRLMADLADRILISDERYAEVIDALNKIRYLLNVPAEDIKVPDNYKRLDSLSIIEAKLTNNIRQLMPSVEGVSLEVELEDTREFFAKGVSLKINDGVLTDVLQKGHGLQRSVVFGLLRMLIESQRTASTSIILAIEEPELYIHPQMQRLIYRVLREFSKSDQVIYSTHSAAFVDISEYNSIAIIRKDTVVDGTKVCQCTENLFGDVDDRKTFKLLNSFGLAQNQAFFARKSILVEGEQDLIAIIATARKLKLFVEYPEEIGWTIVVVGSKGEIPKFQKVLNAFGIPYVVLHEMDNKGEDDFENLAIINGLAGNRRIIVPNKLELLSGLKSHFADTFHAKKYFDNPANINKDLEDIVGGLFLN